MLRALRQGADALKKAQQELGDLLLGVEKQLRALARVDDVLVRVVEEEEEEENDDEEEEEENDNEEASARLPPVRSSKRAASAISDDQNRKSRTKRTRTTRVASDSGRKTTALASDLASDSGRKTTALASDSGRKTTASTSGRKTTATDVSVIGPSGRCALPAASPAAATSHAHELARLGAAMEAHGPVGRRLESSLPRDETLMALVRLYVRAGKVIEHVLTYLLFNGRVDNVEVPKARPLTQNGERQSYRWSCTSCGAPHIPRATLVWYDEAGCVRMTVSRQWFREAHELRNARDTRRSYGPCPVALCMTCEQTFAARIKATFAGYLARAPRPDSEQWALFEGGSPLRLPEVPAETVAYCAQTIDQLGGE